MLPSISNLLNFDSATTDPSSRSGGWIPTDGDESMDVVVESHAMNRPSMMAADTHRGLFSNSNDATTPTSAGSRGSPREAVMLKKKKNSIHFLLNSSDAMEECPPSPLHEESPSKVTTSSSSSPPTPARRRNPLRRNHRSFNRQLSSTTGRDVVEEEEEEDQEEERAARMLLLQGHPPLHSHERGLFQSPASATSITSGPTNGPLHHTHTSTSTSTTTSVSGVVGGSRLEHFPLPAHSIEQLLPLSSSVSSSSSSTSTSTTTSSSSSTKTLPSSSRFLRRSNHSPSSPSPAPSYQAARFTEGGLTLSDPAPRRPLHMAQQQQQQQQQTHQPQVVLLLHPPLSPGPSDSLVGPTLRRSDPGPGSVAALTAPLPMEPSAPSALLSAANRHSHQLLPSFMHNAAQHPHHPLPHSPHQQQQQPQPHHQPSTTTTTPLERNPSLYSVKSSVFYSGSGGASSSPPSSTAAAGPYAPHYGGVAAHQQAYPYPFAASQQQQLFLHHQQQHLLQQQQLVLQQQQQQQQQARAASEPQQQQQQQQTERLEERRRLTKEQKKVLDAVFAIDPLPSAKTKRTLAGELGMSLRSVQMWFHNQRTSKLRKQQGKDAGGEATAPADDDSFFDGEGSGHNSHSLSSSGGGTAKRPSVANSLVFHHMKARTEAGGVFQLVAEETEP